jgi:hypothetical protein
MKINAEGTNAHTDCSPHNPSHKEISIMAGILMWLMGVPLVVIILLYLIF